MGEAVFRKVVYQKHGEDEIALSLRSLNELANHIQAQNRLVHSGVVKSIHEIVQSAIQEKKTGVLMSKEQFETIWAIAKRKI
jgi:uncharacterized membrane protein